MGTCRNISFIRLIFGRARTTVKILIVQAGSNDFQQSCNRILSAIITFFSRVTVTRKRRKKTKNYGTNMKAIAVAPSLANIPTDGTVRRESLRDIKVLGKDAES